MNSDLEAQRAIDKLERRGPDALNSDERTIAAAWLFAAGVANTGFEGYFHSSRGDTAAFAPAALRAIGAAQLADLAAKANAVFGEGGPPAQRDTRSRILDRLSDRHHQRLRELDNAVANSEEDVDELLEAYISAHARH